MSVRIFAPAKINLSLHVGPLGADGRHPLASVVAFADVGDVVTLEEGDGLSISGPFAAALDGENLITRALAALGVTARVHLEKNLPIASGIGGGTADGAAALIGANQLLRLGHHASALEGFAAALGADGPVCVAGRPAFMTGGGEQVVEIELPPLDAVLVNPGAPLATAAVYRKFDELSAAALLPAHAPPHWRTRAEAIAALTEMRNDLEPAARALAPAIGDVLAVLKTAPGVPLARMSGSGATCFAILDDATAAQSLARDLLAAHPGWWVRPARLGAASH